MKRLLGIALTAEILNGAYLYTFDSPSVFYLANILLHLGLGILLFLAIALLLKRQFRELEPEARLACILLFLAALVGILLIYTGTTRPFRLLLTAHVLLACLGSAAAFLHLVVRRHRWKWFALVPVISLAFVMFVSRLNPESETRIANPPEASLTMEEEDRGRRAHFFLPLRIPI